MSEFENRIDYQRKVLKFVNSSKISKKENLLSLTNHAISRWVLNNNISNKEIINSLENLSENLFFLANKSQEQITEEYIQLSEKFTRDFIKLKQVIISSQP